MQPTDLKATPPARETEVWPVICICVFQALAVWAVFGQAAHFEFVNYDDDENVFENPVIEEGLSAHAVGWSLTHAQVSNWVPLTTLSHLLDCQLFGMRAGGHHMVNVFWHAATAILLFLVLRQLTGAFWRGAFVAVLFAVHPLRAESVAWISERKDVLSGFFFVLTIWAYARQARQPSRGRSVAVILFFGLGLLAKSMVATLPVVLLLLDYWPLGRWRNARQLPGLIREKIPLLAMAAGACVATALLPGLVITDSHRLPLLQRIGNALVSCAVYLRQMIFPAGLATPYPIPPSGQPAWKIGLALFLLTVISAIAVMCRKRQPWLLVGWLWYLVMLLPVIGILQISQDAAHADRYTYLPGIGLALAGTWAVADWSAEWKHRRITLGTLMAVVSGALMVCANIQTSYWRDSESLWTRALACTSGNHVAHYNLGVLLLERREQDKATSEFQKAVDIKPDYVLALNNLGGNLAAKGSNVQAIALYQKALEIDPSYVKARYNLGHALAAAGQTDEAISQYRKALELKSDYANAHYGLGTALYTKRQWEESVAQLRQALAIKPDFPEARDNLGKALLRKGDFDEALSCLDRSTSMSTDSLARWNNLGQDFLQKNNFEEAVACYGQSTKLDPRSADARAYLGLALFKNGQLKEAIDAWEQTLAIKPELNNIRINLAWLLATTPDASLRDGARATAEAEKASQLSGGADPAILRTLAAAYAEMGRYRDAAATARRALALPAAQANDILNSSLRQEIILYDAGKPLRDSPP